MPHWLVKSGIQRAISFLPYRQWWNEFFQKFGGTQSLQLGYGMFERRLDDCRTHLNHFLETLPSAPGQFKAVELGTGWFPTLATGLYLCGAGPIWTFDIESLMRPARIQRMLELLFEYDDQQKLKKFLPALRAERLSKLREAAKFAGQESPRDFLARFDIHVMVQDARKTGLRDGSIDLFCSTGVLEYIPRLILEGIFSEFCRIASPRAVMSHYVSMIDQFSYYDRSITQFNYLKYTSRQWRYLESPLTWQNRMRIPDYRELFAQTGFEMIKETNTTGPMEELRRIRLAPEFGKYKREDLLVVTSFLAGRPAKKAGQRDREESAMGAGSPAASGKPRRA